MVLISISPILVLLVFDFNSFVLGWNEGRGGVLFVILFLLIEWFDSRRNLEVNLTKTRIVIWICSLTGLIFYFTLVYFFNFQETISLAGKGCSISKEGLLSWTWLWEYVVFGIYLTIILGSIFGMKAIKQNITPIVYCFVTMIILLLDALFPYQSLGILASTVPFIVTSIVFLLGVSGVRIVENPFNTGNAPWVYPEGNILFMKGYKGLTVLEINWPCAGILSMLIYMLVVIILMVKLRSPIKRKIIYLIIGAIGTFFINILRIFLITLAVAYTNIELRIFHETIGEVLFIIWIMIYLITAVSVESYLSKRGLIRQPMYPPK